MQLNILADILCKHPEVSCILDLESLITFCDLVYWLKDDIAMIQRAHITEAPPPIIPRNIHRFFAASLSVTDEDIGRVWEVLRDVAWTAAKSPDVDKDRERRAQGILPLFLKYGATHDVYFYTLRPPVRVCQDPSCAPRVAQPAMPPDLARGSGVPVDCREFNSKELKEPLSYEAVAFTRDLGPLPAKVVSLYCRGCKSRYYHNYYVHSNASTRTYYANDLPKFIQITQHYFVDREVLLRRCLRRSLSCDEVAESHYVDQGPFRVQMK
ncbi:hypothetical protein OH77DRAFT_1391431 [Trametes cingulata]|nr:hypothetical protein OH77DRAFT_1391431 [Trametes cingulata]